MTSRWVKAAAATSSPTYTSDAITSSSVDCVCADDSEGTSMRGIKQEVRESEGETVER